MNDVNAGASKISFAEFEKIEMRVRRIIESVEFPEAKRPAYKLKIDFGKHIGIRDSSAQLTKRYKETELLHKLVIAVVNFPPKQIANFYSEVLVLGVSDESGGIILLEPESDDALLGSRVH